MDTEAFLAQHEATIHALVYDLALSLGGTISAEHGIGQLKRAETGATPKRHAHSLDARHQARPRP